MEAGLCDGEGQRAYTVYDPILGGENTDNIFNALRRYCSSQTLFMFPVIPFGFCAFRGRFGVSFA